MPHDRRRRRRLAIALSPRWHDEFVGPEPMRRLADAFDEIVALPPDGVPVEAWRGQLLAAGCDAVLSGWGTPAIPPDAAPPLAIVAHTTGSIRGVVTREMIAGGLLVTNWGAAAAPSVAECALLLTLACLRRLNAWAMLIHGPSRGWAGPDAPDLGLGLYGRRVGVHGFGNIARQFIRLVAPFGCAIRAYSAGVPDDAYAAHGVAAAPSLAALFAESDVVVCMEALTDQTRGSVTEPLLRSLPEGGVFVNVGRGAVVDERALERLGAEGRLQIGLDVYEREPLPAASPLRGLPNVTLLPHVAGPTRDQRRACGARAVEALLAFAAGVPVEGAIDVGAYDRAT